MPENLALFILSQLAVGAGVYAAIRADLREALIRVKGLEGRVKRLDGIES